MAQPKLFIIGYVWPEPNSSAAGSRMLQLIQLFLQHDWHIVFASAALLSPHRFELSALGVEEKIIALNDSGFDEYIAQLNPDAVLFDRFFSEEQFGWRVEKNCPHALRLLDTEDLHSLRHARHRLLKQAQKHKANEAQRQQIDLVSSTADELYAVMAADDMAQREIAAIYRCDCTLMISEYEIELLQHHFAMPKQLLFYCPFLFCEKADPAKLPSFSQREHFVAIGNFRHEPNWDAVLYLKYAIWPRMRELLQRQSAEKVELHIYGAYPPPKATQLHQPKEGFFIKGWAQSAEAVLQHARVCLAPLRFGAGIKGKITDAMRCGAPNVTTSIGAESMCGNLPWGGIIADTAEEFSVAAVQLYHNQQQWQQSQQNGFAILDHYFGRENYGELFIQRVESLRENLHAERLKNFTGSMLRHHLHKSTQYMSQWIEAKNKVNV